MGSLAIGSIVEGIVTGITNFGAFVDLGDGKTGLVHISEVANVYVKDIREHLKQNDKIKVKVVAIDNKGKIGLSIRQVTAPAEREKPARAEYARKPERAPSFEDMMTKFLKDSDERQSDLRKNIDSKRNGNRFFRGKIQDF